MDYVIDERGRPWHPGSTDFLRYLGGAADGLDLIEQAVKRLGFIRVRATALRTAVIFRAAAVTPAALIGLFYFLKDAALARPQRQYMICPLDEDDAAQHEIVPSLVAAMHRIEDLVRSTPGSVTASDWHDSPSLLAEPQNLAGVDAFGDDRFSIALDLWYESEGTWNDQVLDRCAGIIYGFRTHPDTDAFTVCFTGLGKLSGGVAEHRLRPGQTLDDLHDREYAGWIMEAYRRCLDDGRPMLDKVVATKRLSPLKRLRTRYYRLLLPWRGEGDQQVLTAHCLLISTGYVP
jgi:hypothetical protein